ncbi:hypothetical protein EV127DRAFT_160051 [Xylaria flabelliformis]|nr:hypothetical protein EV127DRAFT_160051 [Xylaria flabelliformis]
MKLTAALFFLACSSYAVATPISVVPGKVPRRADSFNSDLRQEPRMPIRLPIQAPEPRKVPEKKESKTQRIPSDIGRSLPSSHGIVSTSPKKPSRKPKSYLVRLVRRLKNKSPFSESSIVREETKASTEDWEPEATIVESETKASKEAYILIPSFSTNKTIHYRRVRLCTDMLVVSLALSVIAIIIIIELWKPVATRFRRYRSGHGPICLDDIEITNREHSIQEPCLSCGPIPEARFESNRETSKDEAVKAK